MEKSTSWCPNNTIKDPTAFTFPNGFPRFVQFIFDAQTAVLESWACLWLEPKMKCSTPSSDTHEVGEKIPHQQDRFPSNNPVHYPKFVTFPGASPAFYFFFFV